MPTITVIVPVYKVEQYLRRCVDSILRQTYTDFELILVDDGSPDNCPDICDEYVANDNRVRVIHQENGGLSAARNAGIDWAFANSDSRWLTFIDSDDWVHPQYLEVLYCACVNTDVKISSVGFIETSGDVSCTYSDSDFSPKTISMEEVFFQPGPYRRFPTINTCGKLYCKKLWRDVRFPVGKIHEDRFTTHLLLFQTNRLTYFAAPLYYYFDRDDSITKRQWSPKRLDDLEAVKGQIKFFEERKLFRIRKYFIHEYMMLLCSFYISSRSYPDIHRQLKDEIACGLKKYRNEISLGDKIDIYVFPCTALRHFYRFWRCFFTEGLQAALEKVKEHEKK